MNHDLASEIRSKIDIVDIIGERIPLTARGKNYFGVCPFHDDSNPSLCVSREKQIYTCFSCHATGNVYTFLMNYEHIEFKEALSYLGGKVGVDVSGIHIEKKKTPYDNLYQAYSISTKYFQNNLVSSLGKQARQYLMKRGLQDDVIKEFEVGLSLSTRDDLTKLLMKKNYDLKTLNEIGLSSLDHDTYNDRIMFPLYDVSGKQVGFSGRIYKNVDQNKYLNTKETKIFKKGEMLYHYHKAISHCREEGYVIVMEGFMDVIRSYTIGIKNTVALMGTALTNEQIKLIKRLSSNIILCLDGDDPGRKAALKNGEAILKSGLEVKVVTLPKDDDPDTFILKNGKERFLGLITSAINYSDYKINELKRNVDFRSDVEKSHYINEVIEQASTIEDPIRVEIMLKKLAKEYDIGYNTLEMRLKDIKKSKPQQQLIIPKQEKQRKNKYQKATEEILYFMLNNDWVIDQIEKENILFPSEKSRILSSEIIYYYHKYGEINVPDFYTYVQDKKDIISLLNEILSCNYSSEVTKQTLFLYLKVVREYCMKQEIKSLTNLMKKETDPIEQAKIVERIRKLRIGE